MLSEALPCFQLLRMGPASPGDSPNRDLYTFRPSRPNCTYRLGRRAEVCDVTLVSEQNPALISRIHAEIHAERDADSTAGEWRVGLVDYSTHGEFLEGSSARAWEDGYGFRPYSHLHVVAPETWRCFWDSQLGPLRA